MLTSKNVNLLMTFTPLVYVVEMVISSPEVFHSLFFSDCNAAIRGATTEGELNLWEKGPMSLVRAKSDATMSASKSAHAQEILAVVQGSVSA